MASNTLQSDIHDIISDKNIPWQNLRSSTVFITGATGLVGGVLSAALSKANEEHSLGIKLFGHGRNKAKGTALSDTTGIEFLYGDFCVPLPGDILPDRLDCIFHCAAVTKSSEMAADPGNVKKTMIEGTRNILEAARDKRCKSFVYLSSMEVYGQTEKREVAENDLGFLDLSNPRSCYPEGKRLSEELCLAYERQYNIPVKIARLAQTFGAGTPGDDSRVFAQFARSVIAGKDIELHTGGSSVGNYCYIADTVRALLTILLKGKNGGIYNIANPDASMTIREMAEVAAGSFGSGKSKVVINIPRDIEKRGYAPKTEYVLNADKLKNLGWMPKYGMADMYRRMISDWSESQ